MRGLKHCPLPILCLLGMAESLPAQMPQIPPLPHPELPPVHSVTPPPPWWVIWAGALAALILLALIIWLLLRPKTATLISPRKPRAACLRSLQDLRSRVAQIPPAEISHRVSTVLRRYLAECYAVPALARTTPEIFSGLRDFTPDAPIPKAEGVWRERFAPVAQWCDELSFKPAPSGPEQSLELINQAISKVEEDNPS